jgi:hypothetical protein
MCGSKWFCAAVDATHAAPARGGVRSVRCGIAIVGNGAVGLLERVVRQ